MNVKKPVSPEFRVPPRVRRKRNNSLPGRLQFETYKKEKFYKSVASYVVSFTFLVSILLRFSIEFYIGLLLYYEIRGDNI